MFRVETDSMATKLIYDEGGVPLVDALCSAALAARTDTIIIVDDDGDIVLNRDDVLEVILGGVCDAIIVN